MPWKFHINIVLPSIPMSCEVPLSFRFPNQKHSIHRFSSNTCYMSTILESVLRRSWTRHEIHRSIVTERILKCNYIISSSMCKLCPVPLIVEQKCALKCVSWLCSPCIYMRDRKLNIFNFIVSVTWSCLERFEVLPDVAFTTNALDEPIASIIF